MRRAVSLLALAVAFGAGVDAIAREDRPTFIEIEIPSLILDLGAGEAEDELEIDESLLVRSAAKRLETVMETSAIVTVLTREDIRARGYRVLADVLEDIPGFESYRSVMLWGRRMPMARGAARTILVLWNGIPINPPHSNLNSMWVDLPLDVVQRIEVVSGPGGVLWGANAFVGIVNVVTERGGSTGPGAAVRLVAGGGNGNQQAFGMSATIRDSFLDERLDVYANVTLWSSKDAALEMPYDTFFPPFPGSPDGTITLNESSGPIQTDRDTCVPIVFNADYELEDSTVSFDFLGNYYCNQREEVDPRGVRADHFVDPETGITTPGGSSRRVYESTVAQLRWDRPFGDDDRFQLRAYYVGVRKDYAEAVFAPAGQLGPETPALEATFEYEGSSSILNDGSYRLGVITETNLEMGDHSTIAGAEWMLEGRRPMFVRGAGTDIITILEDGELVSAASRHVLAGYANHKVRLPGKLAVEAGLRVQGGFGDEGVAYDPVVLPAGALIWNATGKTYLKLNLTVGFRPPTVSSGTVPDSDLVGTYYGTGEPLVPERSRAAEVEISTIVLEHTRALRRVHLRFGYQLTELTGLILGRTGDLRNAGTRIIHTVEARADVAFRRGHRLILAGHFFQGEDSDIGPIRHVANYKLFLGTDVVFDDVFRGMVTASLLGAREDLNRLALVTDTANIGFVMPVGSVVVDRTEPVGIVRAGVRAVDLWDERFEVGLFVENAFDAHPSIPDTDYEKRETPFPLARPGRSMYVTVTGRL